MPGKASVLKSPPLLDFYLSNHSEDKIYFNVDIFEEASDFNNDYEKDCYFSVNIFEDGFFNVDNAENSDFTDDQGVNKDRGKRRPQCTPKVQLITKPEEN